MAVNDITITLVWKSCCEKQNASVLEIMGQKQSFQIVSPFTEVSRTKPGLMAASRC